MKRSHLHVGRTNTLLISKGIVFPPNEISLSRSPELEVKNLALVRVLGTKALHSLSILEVSSLSRGRGLLISG